MTETKAPRTRAAIDRNLELICQAREKAVLNRTIAIKRVEDADQAVIASECHIAACDQRITELLDERLRS